MRHDLGEVPGAVEISAAELRRSPHRYERTPPDAKINIGHRTGKTIWSPPLLDKIRFAPRPPRLLRRNWKDTRHPHIESLIHDVLLKTGCRYGPGRSVIVIGCRGQS